jgi:MFS family permease
LSEGGAAADLTHIARRITFTLFVGQSLGSAGFLVASTVNAIVGAKLSGRPSWAGVPTATYQAGMALAALAWGRAMDRIGRRGALGGGLACGVAGAAVVGSSVVVVSFPLMLLGMVLMGAANSALQLGRYVAAEVHPPAERARAISNVVIGGTVGAILGPLLVGPGGRTAQRLGLDELAGPYGISSVLFALALVVVFAHLRPEPREIARAVAALHAGPSGGAAPARPLAEILRRPATVVAIASMVFAHAVMFMLMVITSLHMRVHHHPLSSIAGVISSHVFGMYAFSALSGRAADRFGRQPVIATGATILVAACLVAPLSPRVLPIGAALALLGLGWNLCYVAGSALLSDQLRPAERARVQGLSDFLMGLSSATGSVGSGVVFAAAGYGAMGLVGAAVALIPLALSLRLRTSRPQPAF